MPRRGVPRYRGYKPKNLGLVVIHGKANYLGTFGFEESWERYPRLIADLLVSPTSVSPIPSQPGPETGPTIDDWLVGYWDRHVTTYYLKSGRPTSELDNVRRALRFFRRRQRQHPATRPTHPLASARP